MTLYKAGRVVPAAVQRSLRAAAKAAAAPVGKARATASAPNARAATSAGNGCAATSGGKVSAATSAGKRPAAGRRPGRSADAGTERWAAAK